MRIGSRYFSALALALAATPVCPGQVAPSPVSFSRDVAPILNRACISCHGPAQQLARFDLSSRAALLKGGDKGLAVKPGDAANSPLYLRLTGKLQPAMPLGAKLSGSEIAAVQKWIEAGVPWDGPSLGAAPKPSGRGEEKIFTAAERDWWALRKPVRHPLPQVRDPLWSAHPIDRFLRKALDEKGLEPAPVADRRTLIRRAYLDLVGLSPPIEAVESFVNDQSPDAWRKQVDTLLASPHYGERWGRHWLDVARYADSWGHIHDDDNPNAWRYRDYVIQSFNQDKPYDQFVREQIAGDELDNATHETLIATGFHRIAPRVLFREKQNPHYRYDYLDDMIGTTSRAFLGLTVSCARCHDHKFDPISQLDYYRMMAVFFPFIDYDHPLLPPMEAQEYQLRKTAIDAKLKTLRDGIRKLEEPYQTAAFIRDRLKGFPADVQHAVLTPEDKRTPGQQLLATQVLSVRNARGARRLELSPADEDRRAKLDAQVRELTAQLPKRPPVAAGIRDGDYRFTPDGPGDEPVPGTTAKRLKVDFEGSYVPHPDKAYAPPPTYFPALSEPGQGKLVEPGFLSVITGGGPAKIPPIPDGRPSSGRRRALAEWIVSPDNPLTARVIVNRIWQYHFGRGIAANASNFGKMGSLPTHPELLDWLAAEFIARGWSIKSMHRLILSSRAYQLRSDFYRAANYEKDPGDLYLWRFPLRRVEAEVVRDLILSTSGLLNPQAGGPPFFPPLAAAVQEEVKRVGKWVLTREEPSTWRRSVYSYWKRARKHPMFEVFDQPDTMVSCERRNSTTVPTQALTLLNSEFVLLQSQSFAARVRQLAGQGFEPQVKIAYRLALGRDPSPREMSDNLAFLAGQRRHHGAKPSGDADLAALTDLCNVLLNLNEFLYVQ